MRTVTKLKQLTFIICFLAVNVSLNGQTSSEQSKTDEEKVEEVIIGYISNFFINDYEKMEVNLHERLSKRGVNQDGKLSDDYSKEALKELMENKRAFPLKYQKNIVSDIKIDKRVATAVLDTGYPKTRWKEYIHLAKLNDTWIITDVFWCFEKIND